MTSVDLRLEEAVEWHIAGELSRAESRYCEVLSEHPRHSRANYLIGVLYLQTSRPKEAWVSLQRACDGNPDDLEALNSLAIAHQQLGNLEQAIVTLRKSLDINPMQSSIHSQLAAIYSALGRESDAESSLVRSLEADPNNPDANNNLANLRKVQRRYQESEQLYLNALRAIPGSPEVLFNLNQLYQDVKRFDLALPLLRQALEAKPEQVDWFLSLASIHQGLGDIDAAISAARQVCDRMPDNAEAFYALGNYLVLRDRYAEGLDAYKRAVENRPNFAAAMANLGAAYQKHGNLNEAFVWHQRALQLDPHSANTLSNLGYLFLIQGKFDTAVAYLKRALAVDPNHIESLFNFAAASGALNQLDNACNALQRITQLDPNHRDAFYRLGGVYREQRHHDLAIKAFQRAFEIDPNAPHVLSTLLYQKQTLCDWENIEELSDRLLEFIDREESQANEEMLSPFMVICAPTVSSPYQQWLSARKYAVPRELSATVKLCEQLPRRELVAEKKLRIGYLSGDFQEHPVGYLIPELFESHDRNQFEVYGYSIGIEDNSALRKRIVNAFDTFRDIHTFSYYQGAERIAADGIDILIDLQGHTAFNRAEILLQKPAPIQVNYLGYPGTLGTKLVDYILVDEVIVPASQQSNFVERLVHLPGCYLVGDSRREIEPRVPLRHHLGLPENGIVFCAFNNTYKLTPSLFNVWLRLLKRIPGSVLWLRDGNKQALDNLKSYATRRGIDVERQFVIAGGLPMPRHLSRHRAADLFLDTFPYNQHSTAADSLRMGLPIVTLQGETFASRVASSLLISLGLTELIAKSLDEYEAIVFDLATRPDKLRDVRVKLHQALLQTDLFDGKAFARKVEAAYRQMWLDYIESIASR